MSWHTGQHASRSELCDGYSCHPIFVSPSTNRPIVQTVMNFPHVNENHPTWKWKSSAVPPTFYQVHGTSCSGNTWGSWEWSASHNNRLSTWFPQRLQMRTTGFRYPMKHVREILLLYHIRASPSSCSGKYDVICHSLRERGQLCQLCSKFFCLIILISCKGRKLHWHTQCPMLSMK